MKLGSARPWSLAAGAGVLIVAAVTIVGNNATAPVGGTPTGSDRRPPARAREESVPVSELKLELLRRNPPGVEEPARNPFRFQERAASAPERPSGSSPAAPTGRAATPLPSRPVPSGPTAPVTPPIPLRYIGLMDAPSQSGRLAILSDGRGNVFQGKEGDTIEGRYRVLKVGLETVELAHVDGRGQQTIRLSGQ